jgi:hypothetical protein
MWIALPLEDLWVFRWLAYRSGGQMAFGLACRGVNWVGVTLGIAMWAESR